MAEQVWFRSTSGPRLAGLIDHPEAAIRGWGVFSHGFTLSKNSPAASRICKQLADEGIGMLRFDNLGLGDSEGDWGDGSFSHKVADTVQAARFMNESGRDVRLLVGHSFGGAAVIAAAHQLESVRAVASIGAPYEPGHVEHNYDALVERILVEGEARRPDRRQGSHLAQALHRGRACRRPARADPHPAAGAPGDALADRQHGGHS